MSFRKSRKTVKLKEIVDLVNERNKKSTCDPKTRQGWNSLLEQLLMQADNYQGFRLLEQNEVPENHKPAKLTKESQQITQGLEIDNTRIEFYFSTY